MFIQEKVLYRLFFYKKNDIIIIGDSMLGKIISIEDNTVKIKLEIEVDKVGSLSNLLVSMQDDDRKYIGEITNIEKQTADINLLGEIINEKFVFGVIKKPSFKAIIELVPKEKVKGIISKEEYLENKHLYIGKSTIYDGVDICVDINDFFSEHFAIFGSTGSGKSCSVSRIIQNLFSKKTYIPYRSSIFMFDAYGEYHNALKNLNEVVNEISFKAYTTNPNTTDTELLRIPPWLLKADDIALLLGATKHSQLPIIEKALKLVTVFAKEEKEVIKIKNDIIARSLLDILSSGRESSQIRDQIFSVLSYYNTTELNLNSMVEQPGYSREISKCFNLDATGKIREMELIMNFFKSYLTDDYELNLPDGSFKYTLNDLKDAFDFALIEEGVLKSDKIYDEANILKVRLHSLVNSDEALYFTYPEYITKRDYIRKLLTAPNGRKAQIINFNINYIDDRLAKTITKIYSKMLFDYAKELENRGSFPFHIILEEAHRYVQNDNDNFLLGYNIFERITKEGRKYGVLMGFISQRPSELSETAISQCSNFLIFKMLHPKDVEYIKEMLPNVTNEIIKRLRILQPGNCVAFGSAFNVPVLIRMDMPNPAPSSSSCDLINTWFVEKR